MDDPTCPSPSRFPASTSQCFMRRGIPVWPRAAYHSEEPSLFSFCHWWCLHVIGCKCGWHTNSTFGFKYFAGNIGCSHWHWQATSVFQKDWSHGRHHQVSGAFGNFHFFIWSRFTSFASLESSISRAFLEEPSPGDHHSRCDWLGAYESSKPCSRCFRSWGCFGNPHLNGWSDGVCFSSWCSTWSWQRCELWVWWWDWEWLQGHGWLCWTAMWCEFSRSRWCAPRRSHWWANRIANIRNGEGTETKAVPTANAFYATKCASGTPTSRNGKWLESLRLENLLCLCHPLQIPCKHHRDPLRAKPEPDPRDLQQCLWLPLRIHRWRMGIWRNLVPTWSRRSSVIEISFDDKVSWRSTRGSNSRSSKMAWEQGCVWTTWTSRRRAASSNFGIGTTRRRTSTYDGERPQEEPHRQVSKSQACHGSWDEALWKFGYKTQNKEMPSGHPRDLCWQRTYKFEGIKFWFDCCNSSGLQHRLWPLFSRWPTAVQAHGWLLEASCTLSIFALHTMDFAAGQLQLRQQAWRTWTTPRRRTSHSESCNGPMLGSTCSRTFLSDWKPWPKPHLGWGRCSQHAARHGRSDSEVRQWCILWHQQQGQHDQKDLQVCFQQPQASAVSHQGFDCRRTSSMRSFGRERSDPFTTLSLWLGDGISQGHQARRQGEQSN